MFNVSIVLHRGYLKDSIINKKMAGTTVAVSSTPASVSSTPASVAVPASVAETEVVESEATGKKARRVVDRASVVADFANLRKFIEDQVETLRQTASEKTTPKSGGTGVRFLRSVCSRVKQLEKDATRVMDASKKRPRKAPNTNGGFLKPHRVTPEMASFAGWNPDEMKSRVDITNAICQYVKAHNLNDPERKKNILPDDSLRSLLNYDPRVAGNDPLTYFQLQKLIGSLQVKETKA